MTQIINKKLFDININIEVYDRLTVITGDSGVGKTFLFDTLRTYNLVKKEKFMFFNSELQPRLDTKILSKLKGYIIFIDNADIILDNKARCYIREDKNNYYLVLGRDVRGLGTSVYRIAHIKNINSSIELEYPFIDCFLD